MKSWKDYLNVHTHLSLLFSFLEPLLLSSVSLYHCHLTLSSQTSLYQQLEMERSLTTMMMSMLSRRRDSADEHPTDRQHFLSLHLTFSSFPNQPTTNYCKFCLFVESNRKEEGRKKGKEKSIWKNLNKKKVCIETNQEKRKQSFLYREMSLVVLFGCSLLFILAGCCCPREPLFSKSLSLKDLSHSSPAPFFLFISRALSCCSCSQKDVLVGSCLLLLMLLLSPDSLPLVSYSRKRRDVRELIIG